MFFSTAYWPITLMFAVISALFACLFAYYPKTSPKKNSSEDERPSRREKSVLKSGDSLFAIGIIVFLIDLVLQRGLFYYVQPALVGSWMGCFWPLALALLPASVISSLALAGRPIYRAIGAWSLLLLVPIVQYGWNAWGLNNSKNFADLANVEVMSLNDKMPPTDEQHLVKVTKSMAAQKAQKVLSSKNDYSTLYKIGNLTLQAVNGHRFWAAPLVPTNSTDTFWTPVKGGRATSPGFVMVDAEIEGADAQLHDGFKISLFEDERWNMNLERFVYMAGYDKGTLEDATFEVDDNLQPHYTITYVTPAFGGIAGSKLSKVLVIDVAKEEPVLHEYNQGDLAIKWVDRVVSDDIALDYASNWGIWGQAFARDGWWNWFQVQFHIDTEGTMEPADGENGMMRSYTKDDHNVIVVPMTSRNSTDHGVLGVLVFESDQVKAKYYPGLNGFNHVGSVRDTMFLAPGNSTTKFPVDNLELYNIYGHLTWVAIYTAPQGLGSTIGGYGFMDARKQAANEVAYSNDFQTALTAYVEKMGGDNGGRVANPDDVLSPLNGTIWRIAPNGGSYRFQLVGDAKHFFDVLTSTYQGAPLLRDGDHVSGKFLDTNQALTSVRSLELVGNGPAFKAEEKK